MCVYEGVCVCVEAGCYVRNHPLLPFYPILWGMVSQWNTELVDIDNLVSQLVPWIFCLCLQKLQLQEGCCGSRALAGSRDPNFWALLEQQVVQLLRCLIRYQSELLITTNLPFDRILFYNVGSLLGLVIFRLSLQSAGITCASMPVGNATSALTKWYIRSQFSTLSFIFIASKKISLF